MNIRRRTVLSGALSGTLAGLAPALFTGSAHAAGVSDKELLLGTHLDLSGPVAVAIPPLRNGLEMRIAEANEAGGIQGRKIRLVVEDNASQPAQAVRAVDKLLKKDEVFAMLCPFGSGANVATAKRVLDAGVLVFAPYGASALIRQAAGANPLLFTTNLDYDTTTAAGVRWAIAQLGSRKVGLIYQEGSFGELVGKGVKAALAGRNMVLAAEASYKVGDIDFSSQVARMKAAGVDLVVGATTTRETVAVAAEIRKLAWTEAKFLTASPGRANITIDVGKASVEGIYGIGSWKITPPDQWSAKDKAWVESYRRRFNAEPNDSSMLFYDYADWFLQEVNNVGRDLSADKLAQALAKSKFKGMASYDTQHFEHNHIAPEWIRVEQVTNGQWVGRSEVIDPARQAA